MTKQHRFKIDKLIRDKLPETMRKCGIQVSDRIMETNEYMHRLNDKIIEEAHELINAKEKPALLEELADVFEVLMTMARVHGLTLADILRKADQKRLEKGGFDKRIYSAFVELETGHPMLDYYRTRADQYPEIKLTSLKEISNE